MNYEFTKLGAVEALTEMPENANALVEVDGAIKRVPASALGGPSEVVILPETETTVDDGTAVISTPLQSPVAAGDTVSITYNGTAYECTGVSKEDSIVLGNIEALGLEGGNPNAPFVVGILKNGVDSDGDGAIDLYGMVMPMDGATTITISIVQTEGAAADNAGGGIFEVSVPVTKHTSGSGHDFGEFDKTFAELVAAHNAGKYVRINVCWGIGYSTYGYVIGFGKSNGQDTLIVSMPASPTMPKQVAVYMLYAGDDGKIATEVMGGD